MKKKRFKKFSEESLEEELHLVEIQYNDVFGDPLLEKGDDILYSMLVPQQRLPIQKTRKQEIPYYLQKYFSQN